MSTYESLATALIKVLGLERPPVAVSLIENPPEGIASFSGTVPSACSFWRLAEEKTFIASGADHMNCPVGALTMGFTLTSEAKEGLDQGLALMCQAGYFNPEEASRLPSLPDPGSHLLYGPLSQFPIEPAVVLVWLKPAQAMILQEATGEAEWRAEPASGVFGRPTCAALAVALREKNVALSFGCAGMRVFTEIEPEYMLAVISHPLLGRLEDNLTRTDKANCVMQTHYLEQKSLIQAAGGKK
ncbi:MAG: DUF169 domain-containing protein [Nitrospiria bacterium]